jgi:hypothetical protein
MIQRHDNIGRILSHVSHIRTGQNIIKFFHWKLCQLEQKNQITTRNSENQMRNKNEKAPKI